MTILIQYQNVKDYIDTFQTLETKLTHNIKVRDQIRNLPIYINYYIFISLGCFYFGGLCFKIFILQLYIYFIFILTILSIFISNMALYHMFMFCYNCKIIASKHFRVNIL